MIRTIENPLGEMVDTILEDEGFPPVEPLEDRGGGGNKEKRYLISLDYTDTSEGLKLPKSFLYEFEANESYLDCDLRTLFLSEFFVSVGDSFERECRDRIRKSKQRAREGYLDYDENEICDSILGELNQSCSDRGRETYKETYDKFREIFSMDKPVLSFIYDLMLMTRAKKKELKRNFGVKRFILRPFKLEKNDFYFDYMRKMQVPLDCRLRDWIIPLKHSRFMWTVRDMERYSGCLPLEIYVDEEFAKRGFGQQVVQ